MKNHSTGKWHIMRKFSHSTPSYKIWRTCKPGPDLVATGGENRRNFSKTIFSSCATSSCTAIRTSEFEFMIQFKSHSWARKN